MHAVSKINILKPHTCTRHKCSPLKFSCVTNRFLLVYRTVGGQENMASGLLSSSSFQKASKTSCGTLSPSEVMFFPANGIANLDSANLNVVLKCKTYQIILEFLKRKEILNFNVKNYIYIPCASLLKAYARNSGKRTANAGSRPVSRKYISFQCKKTKFLEEIILY